MSEFKQIRADFNRAVALNGWERPDQVLGAWPVSPEKWLRRFYREVEFDPYRQRRLVNHFQVGADPEFVFLSPLGTRTDAKEFGFQAGLAYGADNNGRLAEIRPAPSRFVLSTLASTWSTMKWMSILHPLTLRYAWRAGAFIENDGLGGHVHFGRRRPQTQREIAALDTLSYWMFQAGIWDAAEGKLRVRNAQGGGHNGYGRLGDMRHQPYGYEYRTFPSWMATPWMAYLSMVLAKLAVVDTELFPLLTEKMEGTPPALIKARLTAILAYFKGRDDDAALAYSILLRHGWPKWHVGDFKASWGIVGGGVVPTPKIEVQVLPDRVPPTQKELVELSSAMLAKRTPELVDLLPSWKPTQLPGRYRPAIEGVDTYHNPGIGEILSSLATLRHGHDHSLDIVSINGLYGVQVSSDLLNSLQPRWRLFVQTRFKKYLHPTGRQDGLGRRWHIALGKDCREAEVRDEVLNFLTCGVFPIWRMKHLREESDDEWGAKWLRPAPKEGEKVHSLSLAVQPKKPAKVQLPEAFAQQVVFMNKYANEAERPPEIFQWKVE